MSKQEIPTETKAPEAKEIKTTLRGYDLSNLKPISKEITVSFMASADPQDAVSRLGNDPVVLLKILNDALEAKTISDAKSSAVPSGFASKKTVLDFIKNYRQVPTFASMVKLEKGDAGWKDQYNVQTDAILSQILSVPFMMDALKAIAAAAPADDSDETEETK